MEWYYVEKGQQIGPLSELDFDSLVQEGKITNVTPVWRAGMKEWQTYGAIVKSEAGPGYVICNECRRAVPEEEAIQFGAVSVCSLCKPLFVQKLKEGATITGGLEYASFGSRFLARFIDLVILWVMEVALMLGAGASLAVGFRNSFSGTAPPWLLFLYPVAFAISIFFSVFFNGKYGATPGKMLLHLRIVTSEGEPITYKKALGRFFAEMISGLTCYIGYIMAAFDEERRTLHDRICDTRVIRKE